MTKLLRTAGRLVTQWRQRLARENADTEAEVREHDMPSGPHTVTWIKLEEWTIWHAGGRDE